MRQCDGFALIAVLTAMLLLSALGAALILLTSSERLIASTYRTAVEAFYAADAMAERAIDDLAAIADWDAAASGVARSTFVDGPPAGTRPIAGGMIDVDLVVNSANCGKEACSSADLAENATGDRPWGRDNPVWQLFAYGPLTAMASADRITSPFYVVALVARNPAAPRGGPVDTLFVRAEAFGPRSSHKVVELTVARGFTGMHDQAGGAAPETGTRQHSQDRQYEQDARDEVSDDDRAGRIRVLTWRELR